LISSESDSIEADTTFDLALACSDLLIIFFWIVTAAFDIFEFFSLFLFGLMSGHGQSIAPNVDVEGEVDGSIKDVVKEATNGAVDGSVEEAVKEATNGAINEAADGAKAAYCTNANGAIKETTNEAVNKTADEPLMEPKLCIAL